LNELGQNVVRASPLEVLDEDFVQRMPLAIASSPLENPPISGRRQASQPDIIGGIKLIQNDHFRYRKDQKSLIKSVFLMVGSSLNIVVPSPCVLSNQIIPDIQGLWRVLNGIEEEDDELIGAVR
jgi:hypothetical protein